MKKQQLLILLLFTSMSGIYSTTNYNHRSAKNTNHDLSSYRDNNGDFGNTRSWTLSLLGSEDKNPQNHNNSLIPSSPHYYGKSEDNRALIKNINAQDKNGRTQLILASMVGSKHIVELIIGRGADINIKDYNGHTALVYAVINYHIEIVKILIEKGADIDVSSISGCTTLILSIYPYTYRDTKYSLEELKKKTEIAQFLIEKAAKFEVRSNIGFAALTTNITNTVTREKLNSLDKKELDYIVYKGISEIVKSLIENDLDLGAFYYYRKEFFDKIPLGVIMTVEQITQLGAKRKRRNQLGAKKAEVVIFEDRCRELISCLENDNTPYSSYLNKFLIKEIISYLLVTTEKREKLLNKILFHNVKNLDSKSIASKIYRKGSAIGFFLHKKAIAPILSSLYPKTRRKNNKKSGK